MAPQTVRRLRRRLGLTQSRFASIIGVSVLTVKRWEAGTTRVDGPAERLIVLLAAEVVTPETVQAAGARRKRRTEPWRK